MEDTAVHLLNGIISATHEGGDPGQLVLYSLLGGVQDVHQVVHRGVHALHVLRQAPILLHCFFVGL